MTDNRTLEAAYMDLIEKAAEYEAAGDSQKAQWTRDAADIALSRHTSPFQFKSKLLGGTISDFGPTDGAFQVRVTEPRRR